MNRNHEWKHFLRVEWTLGLGFSEADPRKRIWVPVVSMVSDTEILGNGIGK